MRKNNWPHVSFKNRKTYMTFRKPLKKALAAIPPVGSKGNKPFQMTMEHFLDSLIYYHLEIPDSGRHLLQVLEQDSFAREMIAPPQGIKKSSCCFAGTIKPFLRSHALPQTGILHPGVHCSLSAQAAVVLPKETCRPRQPGRH